MTDKPWTYHEFHHSPRRKTYSVMEGIRTVAACSREKDARLIVSMKETNAELLEALETLIHEVSMSSIPDDASPVTDAKQAIAKSKENES